MSITLRVGGVSIPEHYSDMYSEDAITPAVVMAEGNMEIRRVLAFLCGVPVEAKILDSATESVTVPAAGGGFETIEQTVDLCEDPNGSRFVRVRCPSSGREYTLYVRPTEVCARAARRHTFASPCCAACAAETGLLDELDGTGAACVFCGRESADVKVRALADFSGVVES